MSVLTEPTSRETDEPPARRIAHIGTPGSRVGLCGAPLLGIKAYGEFKLCLLCRDLYGGDPREMRARG